MFPSSLLTRNAERWLTDTVSLISRTATVDVDPNTLEPVTTDTTTAGVAALIGPSSESRAQRDGRTLGLHDRTVKFAADRNVSAKQVVAVTACADASLVGREGTVTAVERQTHRALRRATVRFDSDG